MDVGRPILAGVFGLTRLPDQVGDFASCLVLAPDCQSVGNGEGRGTARPPAGAHARHRPRNNDDQVCAEARELLLHGIVRSLPDGNHYDQRRYADKDAEHGQRRTHLVARKRLYRRSQDHQAEGPGKRGSARCFCRRPRMKDREAGGRHRRRWDFGFFALVGENAAVPHRYRAIGIRGDIGLVRYQNDRDTFLAVELRQRLHDLVRGARVEIPGRFVGEEQARGIDQGPGDRHPLLLAAGELARRVARAIAKPEPVQRRSRSGITRLAPGLSPI